MVSYLVVYDAVRGEGGSSDSPSRSADNCLTILIVPSRLYFKSPTSYLLAIGRSYSLFLALICGVEFFFSGWRFYSEFRT